MSRTWIVGMSGPGSLANLQAMWDPIKHAFSGCVWVLHDSRGSWEHSYLEEAKGAGEVIHYRYALRHDISRCQYLYSPVIQQGDWCVQLDDSERLASGFVDHLPELTSHLDRSGVNATYFWGKVFMFKHHESLRYQGSPHEGFTRDDGQLRAIDMKGIYPNESDARYNVRAAQRDAMHWLTHYLRYYVAAPWGSNHCLLGNVNRPHLGGEVAIFHQREKTRMEMREYLRSKGVPLTVAGFRDYVVANSRDPEMLRLCSLDKIPNDGFRYFVLKDETVNDNHEWHDLVDLTSLPIPATLTT